MAQVSIQEFAGLDLVTLTEIRAALIAAMIAGLARGTSYTIAGRSFSFSNLTELRQTIEAASWAIGQLDGTRSEHVRACFNPAMGRGVNR